MIEKSLQGGRIYWSWVGLLLTMIAVSSVVYVRQCNLGLGITGMGRDVSWGLYIANFTFHNSGRGSLRGHGSSSHITFITLRPLEGSPSLVNSSGIGLITVSVLLFSLISGNSARVFNIILYPSPQSVLFWDMIVLGQHISSSTSSLVGAPLRWAARMKLPRHGFETTRLYFHTPGNKHPCCDSLYLLWPRGQTLRWLTALLAPRFLASAFASGPSLLIILCFIMRRLAKLMSGRKQSKKWHWLVSYALSIHIFSFLVRLFTIFR